MPATTTEPVIIKKYANRRLYNTETSTYITLADLADIIRKGQNVEVVDAKSGEDLTRATLAQIILDEDAKGAALLPVSFMKTIIGFYDDSMQTLLPHYLDMAMDSFKQNQQHLRAETDKVLGPFSPFAQADAFQNLQRKQLEQLQQVMAIFNPFLKPPGSPPTPSSQPDPRDARIAALEAELTKLKQKQS